MADAGFYIADGIGQLHRVGGALLEQMKRDALGRAHADAGQHGQLIHEVLDALGVAGHYAEL